MIKRNLAVKISSIEAQLEILRSLNRSKAKAIQQRGLLGLKGILINKEKFSEEELEEAKIRFREEP